jgi:hypothetical protein
VPNPQESARYWPGKSLGLPESGPRSIGRLGRRVAAILIDWGVATGAGWLFLGGDAFGILAIFAVLQVVFIATLSGSIGHLVLGLRVVPLNPRWVGIVRPLARTVLLCLLIPAVIWDKDQRGVHDQLAGTLLVRR